MDQPATLFHMVFGYLVVLRLLPLVRLLDAFPTAPVGASQQS